MWFDHMPAHILVPLTVGFVVMFGPTYLHLSKEVWGTDEQGHGPIVLTVSLWLLYSLRKQISDVESNPAKPAAFVLFVIAIGLYVLARSQDIVSVDVGTQILVITALLLWFKGWAALKVAWFPLFFMIFMIPLPSVLVQGMTVPLKAAVSAAAENVLYALGYPISRSGAILSIGQYKLLVADACAGMNSMFTLESIGLLYLHLTQNTSRFRNIALALLVIPISFCSNTIRVCTLVLVTYYFGDEAGQGFTHNLAGFVLFSVSVLLILSADGLLGLLHRRRIA
jgi:exosortase B